jgi:hypothetical protein
VTSPAKPVRLAGIARALSDAQLAEVARAASDEALVELLRSAMARRREAMAPSVGPRVAKASARRNRKTDAAKAS